MADQSQSRRDRACLTGLLFTNLLPGLPEPEAHSTWQRLPEPEAHSTWQQLSFKAQAMVDLSIAQVVDMYGQWTLIAGLRVRDVM